MASEGTVLRYAMVGRRLPPVVFAEYDTGEDPRLAQCAREQIEGVHADVPAGYMLLEKLKDDLVFIVIALRKGEPQAKAMLDALPATFAHRIGIGRAKGATRRFAFHAEFSPSIRRLMQKLDPSPSALDSKLHEVNADLESATGAGKKIIDLVVDRSQKMHGVEKQTEVLSDIGEQFRSSATSLQRHAFWADAKTKIALSLACLCLVLIVVLVVKVK